MLFKGGEGVDIFKGGGTSFKGGGGLKDTLHTCSDMYLHSSWYCVTIGSLQSMVLWQNQSVDQSINRSLNLPPRGGVELDSPV